MLPAGRNDPGGLRPGVSAAAVLDAGPRDHAGRAAAGQLPLPFPPTGQVGQVAAAVATPADRPHPVPAAGWTKPAGRRTPRPPRPQVERRYPTGEQRECEPCAAAGRRPRLGVTRRPGLVACLRCLQAHDRAGLWPTEADPHAVDTCRLCRPSAEPEDAAAAAPMLGSLLPYNPVDRPLAASRPALADPWQAVQVAQQLADLHTASGRPLRRGHDFGRVEVAVAEVYAALTIAYGPVVRPSVKEVYTRVGCCERRAQYALRALQRAGLLYQHSDGCLIVHDDGRVERLAAEYELRIPLAYLDRGELMDELDETVDRDALDAYLAATVAARDTLAAAENTEVSQAPPTAVDSQCTPSVGFPYMEHPRSSDTVPDQDSITDSNEERSAAPSLERPRTARGYALARRLQQRVPRWHAVPLPLLAEALQPLADLSWSAFRVDWATATYGPVTSPSGLLRTLHAVVDYVTAAPARRDQARIDTLTARIVAATLSARRSPAVWSATSAAAREAYQTAAQARTRATGRARPAGWDTLRAVTATPASPRPAPSPEPRDPATPTTAQRTALILARARTVAAAARANRRAP